MSDFGASVLLWDLWWTQWQPDRLFFFRVSVVALIIDNDPFIYRRSCGPGLDGPGIESLWGRDFPHPSIPALGPTQPPLQWVPGNKAAGA
jgi:hypothetical protein